MDIKKELGYLWQSIQGTRFKKLTKKELIKEFTINGIALLFTVLIGLAVHSTISSFVREKNNKDRFKEKIHYSELREKVKILKRFEKKNQDDRIVMEKEEINNMENYISGFIVFIVGLFVFTFVERVMERFFTLREQATST